MKNEAELNGILTKSLTFGHKISDASNSTNTFKFKMPFDGFGIFRSLSGKGYPVYFESKFLRKPEAFNFKRLEDHQINSLRICKEILPESLTLFIICVDFGRADKRVFVFKDMEYIFKRKKLKENILQKEFLKRKNFVKIEKGKIDFNKIIEMPKELEYI